MLALCKPNLLFSVCLSLLWAKSRAWAGERRCDVLTRAWPWRTWRPRRRRWRCPSLRWGRWPTSAAPSPSSSWSASSSSSASPPPRGQLTTLLHSTQNCSWLRGHQDSDANLFPRVSYKKSHCFTFVRYTIHHLVQKWGYCLKDSRKLIRLDRSGWIGSLGVGSISLIFSGFLALESQSSSSWSWK